MGSSLRSGAAGRDFCGLALNPKEKNSSYKKIHSLRCSTLLGLYVFLRVNDGYGCVHCRIISLAPETQSVERRAVAYSN
jgi:hypothetical protein